MREGIGEHGVNPWQQPLPYLRCLISRDAYRTVDRQVRPLGKGREDRHGQWTDLTHPSVEGCFLRFLSYEKL